MDMDVAVVEGIFAQKEHHRAALFSVELTFFLPLPPQLIPRGSLVPFPTGSIGSQKL